MLTAFRIDSDDETEGDLYYEHLQALVRYMFRVDPEDISIQEFAKLAGEAVWIKKFEAKLMESAIINAINKLFNE